MPLSRSSIPTLCSLAAIAFAVACVAHEVIGHGLTCLATGGRVVLLTSVYFSCHPSLPLVDAGGPVLNLVVAAVAAVVLRTRQIGSHLRVLLVLLVAFSGLWGAGYCIFSAVTDTGDLAFTWHDLGLRPAPIWRLAMGIVGIVLYRIILRYVSDFLPKGVPLLLAYCAAGTVACVSVLLAHGPVLPALQEAAQEGLLAPVGLLVTALWRPQSSPVVLQPSAIAVGAGILTTLAFWFTLGRGFPAS